MKNLVNIAKTEEKPFYVDASSITGIWLNPEKDEITAFNEKGTLFWISAKSFDIDPQEMLQKLAGAGNSLVSFPVRFDDKEHIHYISPAAVTYAMVTKVNAKGVMGVIVGVRGAGREESDAAKPEEFQALLDAVKAGGRTLLKYGPEQVHARWYNADGLYIDPKSITDIRDDGYQVNVRFEASGMLDIQMEKGPDVNKIANDIWQGGKDKRDLNEVFAEARRIQKEQETAARRAFADGLAAANGMLMEIKNPSRSIHVRPQDFDYLTTYNDEKEGKFFLSLKPQKTDRNPYPDAVSVSFNTAAERAEAIAALQTPAPQAKKIATPAP